MKMPGFLQNTGVQGVGGVAALEGINTLAGNFIQNYDPAIGDAVGSVVGGIQGILDKTGIENLLDTNPLFETITTGIGGVGAFMLSNKVLGDLGIEKKWLKYSLSAIPTLGAIGVGSAAIPYIVGGSIAYWAGKHGWNYGGKALSSLGGGIKRLGKGVGNMVTESINSTINLATAPFRGLYKGVVENNFITPAPVKAMTHSVANNTNYKPAQQAA